MIHDIRHDIIRRAEATPRLTAVRFGGEAVTYGALAESIESYEAIMERNSMSRDSAFVAGLMHAIPSLSYIDGVVEFTRVFGEVLAWLGRDIDRTVASPKPLRAVG
ncbi:hypothetical protein [Gordonia soli]|uniref:Uncharacterized protein n=1 Tax=Gordonia soli NBRC 108243 TaxID=1223545 RepID=M0QCE4_9ACTN|nr:hypothetical protein [Gordonia soli]GAC66288.1 hypothetical protein GS4_01_00900 [Gordonia soli NBRC 108243]